MANNNSDRFLSGFVTGTFVAVAGVWIMNKCNIIDLKISTSSQKTSYKKVVNVKTSKPVAVEVDPAVKKLTEQMETLIENTGKVVEHSVRQEERIEKLIEKVVERPEEPTKCIEQEVHSEVEQDDKFEFHLPDDFFDLPIDRDESRFSDAHSLIEKVRADAKLFEEFVNIIAKDGNIEDDIATKYEFVYQLTGIRCMPHSQQEGERNVEKIVWKGKTNNLLCIAKYLYTSKVGKYKKILHCFDVKSEKQDKGPIIPNDYSAYANRPNHQFKYCLNVLYQIIMPEDKRKIQEDVPKV